MDKKKKSSKVEKWLQELKNEDKEALPLDFVEMVQFRQHTCTLDDKCPITTAQQLTTCRQSANSKTMGAEQTKSSSSRSSSVTSSSSTTGLDLSSSAEPEETKCQDGQKNSDSPINSSLDSNKKHVLKNSNQHHAAGDRPDHHGNSINVSKKSSDVPLHHTPVHPEKNCSPSNYSYSFYLVCGPEGPTAEIWTNLRMLKNTHPTVLNICLNNSVKINIEGFHQGNGYRTPRRKICIIGNSKSNIVAAIHDLMSAFPMLTNLIRLPETPSIKSTNSQTSNNIESMVTMTSKHHNHDYSLGRSLSRQMQSSSLLSNNQIVDNNQRPKSRRHSLNQSQPNINRHQLSKKLHRPRRLAQNVRFQLTSEQREMLFAQNEHGAPSNPRLIQLLDRLDMELVFLERQINADGVPSVKVRFFFADFNQLTSFCREIDYQIPTTTTAAVGLANNLGTTIK